MDKERYFICPECAELTTWSQILQGCANGGQGMCMCEFTQIEWSDEFNDLDVITPRILHDYIEIDKRWFDRLKSERNHILRLRAFNEIPKDKRLIKDPLADVIRDKLKHGKKIIPKH